MRYKATFVLAFGAGYVLGARAGQDRYQQIMRTVRRVQDKPEVQEAAGVVTAQAADLISKAKETVSSKVGNSEEPVVVTNHKAPTV